METKEYKESVLQEIVVRFNLCGSTSLSCSPSNKNLPFITHIADLEAKIEELISYFKNEEYLEGTQYLDPVKNKGFKKFIDRRDGFIRQALLSKIGFF